MKNLIIICLLLSYFSIAQKNPYQEKDSIFIVQNYTKKQFQIPMRDGTKLFTNVYIPNDISEKKKYPFLMQRTCYNVAPYEPNTMPKLLHYSRHMMYEKFIFVLQDVRGRWMSEGNWTNMTPHLPNKKSKADVDEASDTYDTIEWLLKNISNNNGKVGQYGISYPGFYAIAGALCEHPALVACSPQAPVADFFFDDFHHNGAFTVGYGDTFAVFGVQKNENTTKSWYNDKFIKSKSKDKFELYKEYFPLSKLNETYKDNFFWNEIINHPNYDEFWQKRNILPHIKNAKKLPAIMTVGGWFDAEDLYGPLNIYKTIEKNHTSTNTIVMGPFGHGDWARERGNHMHSNIYFGDSISTHFQKEIQVKFFKHFLKTDGNQNAKLPEAYLFDTGKKEWKTFNEYPVKSSKKIVFYLSGNGKLSNSTSNDFSEYISDPKKPVPYTDSPKNMNGFTPRSYMSEDQRFASRRTDVLTFETDVLEKDLTLGGEIWAKLQIATSGTDADYFVKLIDVYPLDEPNSKYTPEHIVLGGYQQMLRSEVMRCRFRNSFEKPEPLITNQKTAIDFRLQDILHTFKKGHKIMIQVQSTAFPLFDINPQKYVENIYKAEEKDFIKATHKIFGDSKIELDIIEEMK